MALARIRWVGAPLLGLMLISACSNPDVEKVRHVERGDQYVAEKRDAFAVVEYASAVRLDPKYGEAHFKLAQTHERMNNLRLAFPAYIRAADAMPDNREAQLKAAQFLLAARQFEDAKARVAAQLKKDPKDVDALLLQANAMAGLQDPAGAVAQIEEALKVSPDSSQAFLNLGVVRLQTGQSKEAEAAFRRAIELAPSEINPKLALANFLWASGRATESEAAIKEALAKEPQHLLANRMLAMLYLSSKRTKEAEEPLKVVADVSKTPAARFQLADYYIGEGRAKDATTLLTSLSSDPTSFAEAEARLGILDYGEGRVAEAHKRLDSVLARLPKQGAVLALKADWLTRENKLDEALERATAAVAADPQSPVAHFTLAVVHDRRLEIAEAVKSYSEVLRLNPRATAAQVALSRLNLTSGDGTVALRYAEEARRAAPSSLEVRLALVRSLIASKNFARAETEVSQLLKGAPNVAAVHTVNGMLQASRNNTAAARSAYERALVMSPGSIEPLGGLTILDIQTGNPAQAIARLEPEIAKQPNNPSLLALAARAHLAAGDQVKTEQVLRRAVSIDPRFTPGYAMLAQLFMKQRRLDEARAEFEGIAQRDPSSVAARTMVGMLLQAQGKSDEARKSYEATVNGTQDAPVAANNLAYLYAEQGTNLDIALQLATSAKQRLPDDPNVDDTIGWIYYKKDLASLAIKPLEESLSKRPDNAEVLYHLGLSHAKLGDNAKARESLTAALKLDPNVGGGEAKRVLASVPR